MSFTSNDKEIVRDWQGIKKSYKQDKEICPRNPELLASIRENSVLTGFKVAFTVEWGLNCKIQKVNRYVRHCSYFLLSIWYSLRLFLNSRLSSEKRYTSRI